MNERKAYASPAVLTEDLLEQTSLACNATALDSTHTPGGNYAAGVYDDCGINVAKNGAFAERGVCGIVLTGPEQLVVLS